MSREQLVQHLTPPPGVVMPPYPAERDRVYRWALVAAAAGQAGIGAGLVLGAPLVTWVSLAWLLASTLTAAYVFLVWVAAWRTAVLALAIAGAAAAAWLPGVAASLLLAALSIMAAKEAHCFHYPTGRYLPYVSLAAALATLLSGGVVVMRVPALTVPAGVLYLAVAALWGPLLRGRFRLPLFWVGPDSE
jgi:hypothetical protein